MKAVIRLLGLAVLLVAPAAFAADVSGAWKGAFEFNGNSLPVTVNLKTAGDAVTGTVEGLPTTPAEIHDGKLEGDNVSFWITTDYEGQNYKLVYKGKVLPNEIDFTFGTEDGSWGTTLTVKKEGADLPAAGSEVTGAWKGTFEFNGNPVPLTFNLKGAGSAVTGTVEGLGQSPIEIHDGKVEGDTVSFWLNTDYQGQTYALSYKGKLANNQIDFSFGTADGSWGATVTVKKS